MEGPKETRGLLEALNEHLSFMKADPIVLAICGGSALNALGLIVRTTRDIDVFALMENGRLVPCLIMPPDLENAVALVAADYSLPGDWLNFQAAVAHVDRLPPGIETRMVRWDVGPHLSACFLSRLDQIHFKLHAAADRDRSAVHFADLLRLAPTREEVRAAAHWACDTQDPSEGFRMVLQECIRALGYDDVAGEL
jgi:hypothetical protein